MGTPATLSGTIVVVGVMNKLVVFGPTPVHPKVAYAARRTRHGYEKGWCCIFATERDAVGARSFASEQEQRTSR